MKTLKQVLTSLEKEDGTSEAFDIAEILQREKKFSLLNEVSDLIKEEKIEELRKKIVPQLILLRGASNSGKSALARRLYSDYTVVGFDTFLMKRYPRLDYNLANKEWFKLTKVEKGLFKNEREREFMTLLAQRENIVVDETNISLSQIEGNLKWVDTGIYDVHVVEIDVELPILKERNLKRSIDTGKFIPPHVIKDMVDGMTPLSLEYLDHLGVESYTKF